jgi:hypothetical protein
MGCKGSRVQISASRPTSREFRNCLWPTLWPLSKRTLRSSTSAPRVVGLSNDERLCVSFTRCRTCPLSATRSNSATGSTPSAAAMSKNSTTSSRRSPVSVAATKDCGRPLGPPTLWTRGSQGRAPFGSHNESVSTWKHPPHSGGVCLEVAGTGQGCTCQMPAAYSPMVRSLENWPDAAMFKMAFRAQSSGLP